MSAPPEKTCVRFPGKEALIFANTAYYIILFFTKKQEFARRKSTDILSEFGKIPLNLTLLVL